MLGRVTVNSEKRAEKCSSWLKYDDNDFSEIFGHGKNHGIKLLMSLYKGHYKELAASILFFIIKHSPTWIFPIVSANIIDAVTEHGPDAMHRILVNSVVMAVFIVQNVPTNYVHVYFYSKVIRKVELDLRGALVRKLQQLSIAYHGHMQSGRLQSKIMRDVEQIETLSEQIFISMLGIVVSITAALIVVAVKNPAVFLFFLVTVPIAICLMAFFDGKIKSYNRDFRQTMEETSANVMEMVELIPVTRAHALEKKEISKMDGQLREVAKKGMKLDVFQSYFSSISWIVFMLFQVICLAFTAGLAVKGKISVGDVVMYQTYFMAIVAQVSSAVTLIPIIAKGMESVNSIGDVLSCSDIEDSSDKKKLSSVKGEIKFENVGFQYRNSEKKVLENFNFTVHSGETVAFVGESGAGKTTILNLAIGFFAASQGRVLIDGNDIKSINLQSYRSHIAVVPQNSILFTGTLRDNITYGAENVPDEFLRKVVKAANLDALVDSLPDGLDTKIMEHGGNLSGGQRQRISIARAFVRDPEILILDEATSALDNISEKKIQESINNLVKGRTTLIVAHRLSTIRNADRIAVIGNGGLEEEGTYDGLAAKKGEFFKLKQLQL